MNHIKRPTELRIYHKIRIFKQLYSGLTLTRVLMHEFASEHEVTGRILDLGSKNIDGSYNKYLHYALPFEVVFTDLYSESPGLIKMDLEKAFPLPSGSFDVVMCFNVLEHLFDAQNLFCEVSRILKPSGLFIGAVPFIMRYHADPHDYHRYTHEALVKYAQNAGFRSVLVKPLGMGPCTAATAIICVYLPGPLRALLHFMSWIADSIFFRNRKIVEPLGYGFEMRL